MTGVTWPACLPLWPWDTVTWPWQPVWCCFRRAGWTAWSFNGPSQPYDRDCSCISPLRERALTTGLGAERRQPEHSGLCRTANLSEMCVQVKKAWKSNGAWRTLKCERNPLLNSQPVKTKKPGSEVEVSTCFENEWHHYSRQEKTSVASLF